MIGEEIVVPGSKGTAIESIFSSGSDPELDNRVNTAVAKIILLDDRFDEVDFETIDALRDWVRAEAIYDMAFCKFMSGDTTASTERMLRFAGLHKNSLRDEIFGRFKGRSAKKAEVEFANMTLMETGIITPKTEVDVLGK